MRPREQRRMVEMPDSRSAERRLIEAAWEEARRIEVATRARRPLDLSRGHCVAGRGPVPAAPRREHAKQVLEEPHDGW